MRLLSAFSFDEEPGGTVAARTALEVIKSVLPPGDGGTTIETWQTSVSDELAASLTKLLAAMLSSADTLCPSLMGTSLDFLLCLAKFGRDEILAACLELFCIILPRRAQLEEVADKQACTSVLDAIREILLTRMVPRHEFVFYDKEDDGEIVREEVAESANTQLYDLLTDTLGCLNGLDGGATVSHVISAILLDTSHQDFGPKLDRLCWALGALGLRGHMRQANQVNILASVIADLAAKSNRRRDSLYVWFLLTGECAAAFVGHGDLETSPELVYTALDALSSVAVAASLSGNVPYGAGMGELLLHVAKLNLNLLLGSLSSHQQQAFYSAMGTLIRHVRSAADEDNLVNRLFRDTGVDAAIEDASRSADTFPDGGLPLLRSLQLHSSAALTLQATYFIELETLFPHFLAVYRRASALLASSEGQHGADVDQGRKQLSRIRKELLLVMSCYTVGLGHCSSTFANGQQLSGHPALRLWADNMLPQLLDTILPDFSTSPIELAEVALLEFCGQTLSSIGCALKPNVMMALLNPGVSWMLRHIADGSLDNHPDLRRAAYFVGGFAISHRALKLEHHTLQAQDELVSLCNYGMAVKNRDVAKNALVAAYHLVESCSPLALSSLPAPEVESALAFFRRHALALLTRTWELMNDGLHANTFENQAPLITRIWEVAARHEQRVFEPSTYNEGEGNVDVLRRWFVEMLLQTFPAVASDVEACYAIFGELWILPRTTVEDEDAFAIRLRDLLIDLVQFRGSAVQYSRASV
ncbi:hypothetical protein JCM5296_000352 [Sporobolomyces johnsonii]